MLCDCDSFVYMNKQALWIISEAGLQSLTMAGISTGWLKAWLLSAGATDVEVHLLESATWQDSEASWQLFFADESELMQVALFHGHQFQRNEQGQSELSGVDRFSLHNPLRSCWHYQWGDAGTEVLLLPTGDIAYQRYHYLSRLNPGQSFLPLYISTGEEGEISLETGLSGSLVRPDSKSVNDEGILIEEQVMAALHANNKRIRTVESCTGGGIAARLCRIPGASDIVDRAWVTYSNNAKREEVGVSEELLDEYGAVSERVVATMAEGGVDSNDICVAVSGIAGPDGGTIEKPVGTVWIATAVAGQEAQARCYEFPGGRCETQARAVLMALVMVLETLGVTTQLTP
jgi:PncC family amidohydrolase